MTFSARNKIIITAIIMLILGAGIGYLFKGNSQNSHKMEKAAMEKDPAKPLFYRNPMNPEVTSPVPAKDHMGMDYIPVYAENEDEEEESMAEKKILFYRSPMNPEVTSPTPAKDAMGMDYVAVYAESNDKDDPSGTIKIDPLVVQNIGVRTAKAERTSLSRTIRAVGKIDLDEEGITRIHSKTEGWIEELFIDKTGENVKIDTMLLSIYSPKLVSTQEEYLLALDNYKSLKKSNFPDIKNGAKNLLTSTKERLELFDVPAHQIKELEESRKIKKNLHIHSPAAGTIIHIGVRKGQYVTPGTELYKIADLSKIWVYADIYENEISWVKAGDKVEMTLKGIPGKVFEGSVDYIYPYAETKTRTIKVRLIFDNPNALLRPEMFAEVIIHAQKREEVIVIPAEAIVRSGVSNQVFIVRGKGKFAPRTVTLGLESDNKVIILKGLEEGEEVVTSAQFLIDSESKLKEATDKMMKSLNNESEKK